MTIITGQNPNTAYATNAANQTIILAPDATAFSLSTNFTGSLIVNYGTVHELGIAVNFMPGASGQFINKADGVLISNGGSVFIQGAGSVVNEGTILCSLSGGVTLGNSANNNSIVNSGDIYGHTTGIYSWASTAQNVSISNSGEVHGDNYGIWLLNASGAAPVIVNTGTISGRINSIRIEGGDRLNATNSGSLVGDVLVATTDRTDRLINNGTVTGNVSLNSGVDVYQGSGRVSGIVYGEIGSDSLTGGGFADRFNGGADADTLIGNGGNDILNGTPGNDRLFGGLGIDSLNGGADVDFFIFNTAPNTATNRDFINDFSHALDTLQFENAVFTKLGGVGMLNAQFLRLGAAPLDANDYLIYNKATGILTYDVNGNGAGGAQQVAVLTTKPTLALGDFVVI
jgi:Ca2+-binding RTX toxin-like protein